MKRPAPMIPPGPFDRKDPGTLDGFASAGSRSRLRYAGDAGISVQGDAILARALGRVERLVRGTDQLVGSRCHVLGERRDAEAGGDLAAVTEAIRGHDVADA